MYENQTNWPVNDSTKLFSPDLLSLHIQKVLDVLNRALQANECESEILKLLTELAESGLSTLDFGAFCVPLQLVSI